MKVNDVILGKEALIKLNNTKFNDFKIVMSVYKLVKSLDEVLDMAQSQQQKIFDTYHAVNLQNGTFKFNNEEDKRSFLKEMDELKNTDIDSIQQIKIPLNSVQNAPDISARDLVSLAPFVEWIE